MEINRRELIKRVAAGTATLFILPAMVTSCEEEPEGPDNPNENEPLSIDLSEAAYSDLNNVGGFAIVQDIIVFNDGNEIKVLSSVCTHQGCTVSYNAANNQLPCPCHGSLFSATGSVVNGPAEAPLKKYTVSREGDILFIE